MWVRVPPAAHKFATTIGESRVLQFLTNQQVEVVPWEKINAYLESGGESASDTMSNWNAVRRFGTAYAAIFRPSHPVHSEATKRPCFRGVMASFFTGFSKLAFPWCPGEQRECQAGLRRSRSVLSAHDTICPFQGVSKRLSDHRARRDSSGISV